MDTRVPRPEPGEPLLGPRALVGVSLAVVGLYAAGAIALGTPPTAADSGEAVAAWFREHRDGVRWSVWATTVNAPLLALMTAHLRRLLPSPHRDVFLIGAIGLVVTVSVQSWTWGGLALHADHLEPVVARALLDVALFWGPVLTGATTTMIAPVTWLALRGRAGLPRWLGLVGAVAFVEQAVETMTIFGSSGFTEPGGAMNLQLGAGLVIAWWLCFAVWGSARREPAPS
jgi:hypothetical protein